MAVIRARAGDGAHPRSRPDLHPGVGQGAFRKRRLLPGEPLQLHLSRVLPRLLFWCAERGSSLVRIDKQTSGRPAHCGRAFYRNFGESEVRAFDFAINWSAMTRIGEVNSSLLATYLDRWDRQPFPDGEVLSFAGNFDAGARPRWRALGRFDWHSGPGWRATPPNMSAATRNASNPGRSSASFSSLLTAASIRFCITTSKRDSDSTQASRCERLLPMSLTKTRPISTSRPPTRMCQLTGCWAAATFGAALPGPVKKSPDISVGGFAWDPASDPSGTYIGSICRWRRAFSSGR